jgi:hypothetical protein
MSAVASADAVAVNEQPVPEIAAVPASWHDVEAAEQKRWMLWFGVPALVASIFVGATFATGHAWVLSLAIGALLVDIFVLVWLAMSSDTNGLIGEPSSH